MESFRYFSTGFPSLFFQIFSLETASLEKFLLYGIIYLMILDDYRNERLRKLEEIRARGVEPYPSKSERNTLISDVVTHFDEKKGQEVCIAGRIVAIRSFGKLV